MRGKNTDKQRLLRKTKKLQRRKARLNRRPRRTRPKDRGPRIRPVASRREAEGETQHAPPHWQKPWALQLAAMLALCLTGVLAMAIPACAGSKSRPLSFREQSVEIASIPKDAVFYLDDIQGSPVAEVDSTGKAISRTAYHPYGHVRYQSGKSGDPWGYVANEEDRGSGISDFHARPYLPEAGIFASVDPQALFRPEKIIGQPSRAFPYAYAAGNPVSQSDKNGEDYTVSVHENQITVTFPVNLHGSYNASDVSFLQKSFEQAFASQAYAYTLGKKTYDVKFRLDISQKGAPVEGLPPEGTNKITIVPKKDLGINPLTGNAILGGATCMKSRCRTATFPIAHLRDGLTVPHEIGHLTGMQHHPDPANLMYKTTYGPDKKGLTQSQVATILDRPMFHMPAGARDYNATVVARPMEPQTSEK